MKTRKFVMLFILNIIFLASCQSAITKTSTPAVTRTVSSTITLTSSSTSAHTPLPTFTQTVTPSPTNTLTPTISPLIYEILKPGEIVEHPATEDNPYVYYSYFPDSAIEEDYITITVWPHGGGMWSSDYSYHKDMAKSALENLSSYAEKYKVPILVAAIPRIQGIYANSLDLNTFTSGNPFYFRPDLKIEDIIWNQYLPSISALGYKVDERVFMIGFSSPGTFTLRFTLLHPELIKAAWCGASSFAPLPTNEYNGLILNYPLGLNNIETLTGESFDIENYKHVPHLIVIGENDNKPNNVTLPWYPYQSFIRQYFGETEPERVRFFYEYLLSIGVPAEFHLYRGIGHERTNEMMTDAFDFLLSVRDGKPFATRTPYPTLPSPTSVDWSVVEPIARDEENDTEGPSDTDIHAIYLHRDAAYLYIMLEMAAEFDPEKAGIVFDLYVDGVCINVNVGTHTASNTGIDIYNICGTVPSAENRLSSNGANVVWGKQVEIQIPMSTFGNPKNLHFDYFSTFGNEDWENYDMVFP